MVRRRVTTYITYAAAAGLTLASFVIAPLPRTYFHDLFLHRPEEFVPALFVPSR
jgi:hypothetical protein